MSQPGSHTPPELGELVSALGIRPGDNVLICGLDYWPDVTGIAPYTTGLAEHLAATGHEVHVIAGMPYYPSWTIGPADRRRLRRAEERNGVDIHRRRQLVRRRQSALTRAAYEASFLANGLTTRLAFQPDIVIGVVPALADGLLAARFARQHRARFALWVQDLLGQAATQSGVEGGRSIARAITALEGWIARRAVAVAIVAEGYRPVLESLGVDSARIHRVRNWPHIGPPTMTVAEARDALGLPHDKTICLHAGNMGFKQGLENVVEAARLAVTEAPELSFVLLGDGNQRPHLEQLAHGLPNVRFMDPVPPAMFPNALHAADVLLINQRDTVTDMSLPSKLTSYLTANRPIFAAVHPDSEAARAIEELNGGVVVEPNCSDRLLMALVDNLSSSPQR